MWLNLSQFFQINLASAFEKIHESARAISESAPPEIRQAVDEIVEGSVKIDRYIANFHTDFHHIDIYYEKIKSSYNYLNE